MKAFTPYVQLMRPHQWIKNLLIAAPAFFAGTILIPGVAPAVMLAVFAFSLVASAVYIVNDIIDCEHDSNHPTKCHRPLPAGSASTQYAAIFAAALLVAGLLIASLIPTLLILLVGYAVLNLLYSRYLKHEPVIDIVTVACFYVMRIVAGGIAALTELSPWIVLATFFLALFLVAGKRYGEFGHSSRRQSLESYAHETLAGILIGSASLAVVSYGLWSILSFPSSAGVYTVIPVAAAIFRTLNHLYQDPAAAEAPEIWVFRDPWTLAVTLLWGISMLTLVYSL